MKSAASHAQEVLRKYWDAGVPVDPFVIARNLNIDIAEDSALAWDGLSGKFWRDVYGDPFIRFNPSEPEVRRRFTVAHEIGHYIFGHGKDGVELRDPTQNFSSDNYDPKEVACNRFAAELLMPAVAIKHYIMDLSVSGVENLAAAFIVSEVAMKYRLANLGWVS